MPATASVVSDRPSDVLPYTMSVPLAFGWRRLLFTNWSIDSDILSTHIPEPFAVHEYDGRGWLTVVPFINVNTRPLGFPERWGVDLPELNLRTYVTHEGEPGVYFFSLDAPSTIAVLGARLAHRLPYYHAQMSVEHTANTIHFQSRRRHPGSQPVRYEATYQPRGDPFEAEPDSLALFLTERRRLYTLSQDGHVRYTDVDHERWTLYEASVETTKNTLFQANGFAHPAEEPVCYYSPGVDVVTTRSKPWGSQDRHR